MPYTGPSDPSLLSNVKKLPPKKRRQWINICNTSFANCRSPSRGGGRGSVKKCESMAFRFANGSVKELEMLVPVQCTCGEWIAGVEVGAQEADCESCKSKLALSWPDATEENGDKCIDAPCAVIDAVRPYGGAQSFGDVDAWRDAFNLDMNVQDQKAIFDGIWDNVWADETISIDDKRRKVGQALVDLAARIINPPEGRRSLVDKVKSFLHLDSEDGDLPELESEFADAEWEVKQGEPGIDHTLAAAQIATVNFVSSPRNKYGTHASKGFKGNYAAAWKVHFSQVGRGALTGTASGPVRGTVRRTEMIAAVMKPACKLPSTDTIGPRGGGKSPLPGSFPRKPSDYGLSSWASPSDGKLTQEDIRLTCADLTVIKKAALAEIKWRARERERQAKKSSFVVTKDVNGEYRWLAIHSNKYEDLDGEGFTEAAHKEYEAWVAQTKNYPELRLWHIKGSRIGVADLVTYADGFVLSSGVFDPGCEQAAKALAEMQDELGVSHGFYHPKDSPDKDGFYQWYRTFEISPLPQEHAANPWTEFSAARIDRVKEVTMALEPHQKAYLVQVLGQDRADEIEEALPRFAKELEDAGVNFKSLTDGLATEEGDGQANGNDDTADDSEGSEAGKAAGEGKGDDDEEDSAEGEGEGKGEGDDDAEKAQTKRIATAVAEAVGPRLKAIEDRLVVVERSDDEKVSDAMAPKGGRQASRPSQSDDNALGDKAAKDIKDVLDRVTGDTGDKDKPQSNPVTPYVEDMAATLTRGR